jgi:hypothetical protein
MVWKELKLRFWVSLRICFVVVAVNRVSFLPYSIKDELVAAELY